MSLVGSPVLTDSTFAALCVPTWLVHSKAPSVALFPPPRPGAICSVGSPVHNNSACPFRSYLFLIWFLLPGLALPFLHLACSEHLFRPFLPLASRLSCPCVIGYGEAGDAPFYPYFAWSKTLHCTFIRSRTPFTSCWDGVAVVVWLLVHPWWHHLSRKWLPHAVGPFPGINACFASLRLWNPILPAWLTSNCSPHCNLNLFYCFFL